MTALSLAVNGLVGAIGGTFARGTITPTIGTLSVPTLREQPAAMYAMMRALSANTNAYKDIATILSDYGLSTTAMQGLRNPTHSVNGFYEANMWNGVVREDDEQSALPLEAKPTQQEKNLRAAIHKVWRWSNLNDQKDGAAYDAAMLGDQVFKVVSDRNTKRAWFELVPPDYMTDLDVDGRGYLTYIRLDVPQVRRLPDGKTETFIHTEVWDKANQSYRRWERKHAGQAAVDQLGAPAEELNMEQVFGVDFVPFVHWQFDRESGSLRGVPAVMRALDKILYGDALVTALHRRLARETDWVLEGVGTDQDGIPLPAPNITNNNGGEVTFGDGSVKSLPAGWRLRDLVAGLDYAAHLAVVQDHYQALREMDLPELAWGAISEAGGDASGKALNYKLTPAKSKLEKARGRAESSLIRATQMCLSVAQQLGAPGFGADEIGTYVKGDLDFWMKDRALVPLSEAEQSEIETQRVTRVGMWEQMGWSREAAMLAEGATDEQVTAMNKVESDALSRGIER